MNTLDEFARQSRGTARRRLATYTMVLLAVISVGIMVVALLWPAPAKDRSATPRRADSSPAAEAASSTPSASSSGFPTTDPSVLPSDLTFATVLGVRVPVSPTIGPKDMAAGRGFAQTPIGAVLAAVQIILRTTPQAGSKIFESTFDHQVTGAGAAGLRFDTTNEYESDRLKYATPYGDPAGTITVSFYGYQIESSTDTTVTLRLLTQTPDKDGQMVFVTGVMQMVWATGDWWLVAPPNGDWETAMTVVPGSAAGAYTPFGPGR